MRKNDSPVDIDELMLNVLGEEFFRVNQIRIKFMPVLPKKKDGNKDRNSG